MQGLDVVSIAFENATPGEVVGEIAGGNAMKPGHPFLEPVVIGIDVLDVESTGPDTLARAVANHLMGDAATTGKGSIDAGPVTTENGLGIHQGLQGRGDVICIQFGQLKVCRMPFPVPHHHYRNLIGSGASRHPDAATSACRPGEMALSLEGLEEESLIHFDDALFVQGLMSYGRLQEPVSPQEGRILGNAALTGGSPHGDPINQGLSVIPPTICLVQPGQGRAR